jgi:hypothetical protein
MLSERELQINPIVPESIQHNTKVRFPSSPIHTQPLPNSPPLLPSSALEIEKLTPPNQALTQLHNLTASLFGIGAGILGLESYSGFLFYLLFSLLTTSLLYLFRVRPKGSTDVFFQGAWSLWTGGLVDGLSGFVLTWTLFYGLVRA